MDNIDKLASITGALVAIIGVLTTLFALHFSRKAPSFGAPSREVATFTLLVEKLGSGSAGERIQAIQGLVELADSWNFGRQTCIDVLCAYLRLPTTSQVHDDSQAHTQHIKSGTISLEESSARSSIVRAISQHLRADAHPKWHGYTFDFTGAQFDAGDFSRTDFSGGTKLIFREACFTGGTIDFSRSTFDDAIVDFSGAAFPGGTVDFSLCKFTGGSTVFRHASFSGGFVDFSHSVLARGEIDFSDSSFSGGEVSFAGCRFEGTDVAFMRISFEGGKIDLRGVSSFTNPPTFDDVERGHSADLLLP